MADRLVIPNREAFDLAVARIPAERAEQVRDRMYQLGLGRENVPVPAPIPAGYRLALAGVGALLAAVALVALLRDGSPPAPGPTGSGVSAGRDHPAGRAVAPQASVGPARPQGSERPASPAYPPASAGTSPWAAGPPRPPSAPEPAAPGYRPLTPAGEGPGPAPDQTAQVPQAPSWPVQPAVNTGPGSPPVPSWAPSTPTEGRGRFEAQPPPPIPAPKPELARPAQRTEPAPRPVAPTTPQQQPGYPYYQTPYGWPQYNPYGAPSR